MKLKVSSKTDVKKLAGSIAKVIRNDSFVEIQVIGAAAVNQAVKSIAIAEEYLKNDDAILKISTNIKFIGVEFDGIKESAILFKVGVICA